jgi:hypothetical protein
MGAEKREILIDNFVANMAQESNKHIYNRRFVLTKLRFEITGALVVAVASAVLLEDGILNLIKRISFTLFGDTTPFSNSGRLQHKINSVINADREFVSQPAVTAGTNQFSLSLDIPFTMNDFIMAEGFKLVTDKFRGREIKEPTYNILFGDVTDVATPGMGGTVALGPINVNVYALDEDVEQKENEIREEIIDVEDRVIASASDGLIDLRDNNILRRIAIQSRDNATGLLDDTVIDSVQIVRNQDQVIKNVKWIDLQNEMKKEYGLGDDLFAKVGPGFVFLQLDKEKDLSGFIDTAIKGGTKTIQLKIIPTVGKVAKVDTSKEMVLGRSS